MAAAPLGWGAPYPFTNSYPVSRLPRITDAQSDKIRRLMARLCRCKHIPQTSYIPSCLNAYNCRTPVLVNHRLWAYVHHRIITIRAPGSALKPIRITPPQPLAARVRRDFNTPWRDMMPMAVFPHVVPLPRGPADPRYRLGIFIHKHPEANSSKAVYSMTIFDRQMLGREPDIQSGMQLAALPTLLVFLIRLMTRSCGGPGRTSSSPTT
ncbi:hypothetical protein DL768_010955 [Monosporascus sp. mg162]|nr:hypothetical protein DL768_010955 [Monosporascus sp. mg162]